MTTDRQSRNAVKLALMNGQTLQKAFVPLPGGTTAVYTSAGLAYYRHSDWRFASTPVTRAKYFDVAYAPYGEDYADSGTVDLNFTGQNQDTVSGLYDFLYREYHPVSGRWIQPDPAGMGAVSMVSPQSWNRYAYVSNAPSILVDALGLVGNNCHGKWVCPDGGGGAGGSDPFAVFDGPNGERDCYADGISAPCDFVFALVAEGNAAFCPNSGCDSIRQIEGGWEQLAETVWSRPTHCPRAQRFTPTRPPTLPTPSTVTVWTRAIRFIRPIRAEELCRSLEPIPLG